MLADEAVGAGHGHAQADATDHRQIGQIVTQIRDLLIGQAQLAEQFIQNDKLVLAALVQVLDTQVLRAALDHRGLASADDGGAHPGVDQHLDAVAVEGVEGLELAAIREEVQAAVGEHAVDVEDGQFHALGALQ